MNHLKRKKLLILGGANQHLKFVEAAKDLNIYTIVTDNLQNSPCKKICDKALFLDINDIDGIVSYCKENHVNGIISGFLDPCQIPYGIICSRLGLPCYGTSEQFYNFTNKNAFKKLCKENNVKTIPDYTLDDYKTGRIIYPVYVKPVDSRGSRGQSICISAKEMSKAIKYAQDNSSNGDILIEQYLDNYDEVQITYFVINGKIYLERTVDSIHCNKHKDLQKVVNCSISPSKHTEEYLKKTHLNVCKMIKSLGIKNGPIFMQGFYKDGDFLFFDPGLRFPGVEYERIYKHIWNIDFAKLLIKYALTGAFPNETKIPENGVNIKGRVAAILFPILSGGRIGKIEGLKKYSNNTNIISCLTRYKENDIINWTYDVNQRFAEIDIIGDCIKDVADTIDDFYKNVKVLDIKGNNMLFDYFHLDITNT